MKLTLSLIFWFAFVTFLVDEVQAYWQRKCEGTNMNLGCHRGRIQIRDALYGRNTKSFSCGGPIKTTNCKSSRSLSVMKKRCNGRRSCSVPATNSVFGDPCYGTKKFLQASYACQVEIGNVDLSPQCIQCLDELCPEIAYGEWETCLICIFECVPLPPLPPIHPGK